ncbi:MAG: hypothetical protein AAGI91_11985 [Bacteroidota bacterium]
MAAIIALNGGVFAYTLDDPYIHLALAEEIARGHYGVNPGEGSAPSSSILWPLLLALGARLPGAVLTPLVLNIALSAGAVWAAWRVLLRVLPVGDDWHRALAVGVMGVAFVVGTHLIGLVLNGMEHVLQLALSVLIVWGLIRERETGQVAWWLMAALVLAPLARYECLALTVPALALLLYRRHARAALVVAVATAVPLAAFSAFLLANGQEALPTSVLLKSQSLGEESVWQQVADGSVFVGFARNLVENMRLGTGRVLAVAWLGLLAAVVVRGPARADKALALWAAAALGLHLAAGQLGWFGRYEVYVWAVAVLVLLWVSRAGLRRLVDAQPPLRFALLATLAVGLTCQNYIRCALLAPAAANDVYEQHGQMHRFATEFWQGPVGTGDIGWVSFQNDHYVLDLNGLASLRTLELQEARGRYGWVDPLTEEAGVRLLMAYESTQFSPSWIRLGTLHLSGPVAVTPANDTVTFLARDEATAQRVRTLLPGFIDTLPPGVRFEWTGGPPAALSTPALGQR